MFAVATPVLGPRLLGRGRQRVPRNWFRSDTDERVWTRRDIDLFLRPLRDPDRAKAARNLYREPAICENSRAAAGRYRTTRLRTSRSPSTAPSCTGVTSARVSTRRSSAGRTTPTTSR